MTLFPEHLIETIRQGINPRELIQKIGYRPEMIQDAGKQLKAFCPIHRETIFRTLIVDIDEGTFQCSNFRCPGHQGGDLIELYAQSKGLPYDRALPELARMFNIDVDLELLDKYLRESIEVAQNYLELGVWAEAEEHFERLLKFKPDSVDVIRGLVRVYGETGKPDKAEKLRHDLVRRLAGEKLWDEMLNEMAPLLDKTPEDPSLRRLQIDALIAANRHLAAAEALVELGETLSRQGEIDQALECFRDAQGLGVDGLNVAERIQQVLMTTGRVDEAISENCDRYERCLSIDDFAGAVKALEQALRIDPLRGDLAGKLAELENRSGGDATPSEILMESLDGLIGAGELTAAENALKAIMRPEEDRPPILTMLARIAAARGQREEALDLRLRCIDAWQRMGRYERALEMLDETDETGQNVPLLSRKANILREMGRGEDAIPVYLDLVDLFEEADEYEHAAAVLQTLIDLEPDSLDYRRRQLEHYMRLEMGPVVVQKSLALAEAHRARGERPAALHALDRALAGAPSSPELLGVQAELFEECGRRGEAAEQFYALGRVFWDQDSPDRARQMIDRALRCVPEHLDARELRADILADQGNVMQALGIYTDLAGFFLRENEGGRVEQLAAKVLALEPDHPGALEMLAYVQEDSGRSEQALETRMRLVQHFRSRQSFKRASDICAEILARNEDYAPALEEMARLAEINTQSESTIEVLWKLSQVYAQAQRREDEQRTLESLLEHDRTHDGAWYRILELGMLGGTPGQLHDKAMLCVRKYNEAGKQEDCIRLLDDLRRHPGSRPEICAGLAALYESTNDREGVRDALRSQAEMAGRLMRDDEALAIWKRLAELQPEDVSIPRMRIEIMLRNDRRDEAASEYRTLARRLSRAGQSTQAEMAYQESLALDPQSREAHEGLIDLALREDDPARAAALIEEAASAAIDADNLDMAVEQYQRLIEIDPDRVDVNRKLIAIERRLGHGDRVIELYLAMMERFEEREAWAEFEHTAQEAIRLEPEGWRLRERLGRFYVVRERLRDAESTLVALAAQHLKMGQLDEAEAVLAQVGEINPASIAARAHLAEIMARRGQTEQALSAYMQLTGAFEAVRIPGEAVVQMQQPAVAQPFAEGNYLGMKLVKDYTFDTFIVGERNNFAHATALAVCRDPGHSYNPLFLYSDVGLGKTHLCHAVANYIVEKHPELRVIYTTTEEFVGELIEAIQTNQIGALRARHKATDVLIVDDVQFLAGREQAQEEFFHVFNAIFQEGRQVVLTSDRPPKDISHLERRLKSRFGAGVIVDIQSPDLETRLAILKREMENHGDPKLLTEEVLLYIAEKVTSNVRELKGAFNQVLARQRFTGEKVDVVLVRQILEHTVTGI